MAVVDLSTKKRVPIRVFAEQVYWKVYERSFNDRAKWQWGMNEISRIAKESFGFSDGDLEEALTLLVRRRRFFISSTKDSNSSGLRPIFILGDQRESTRFIKTQEVIGGEPGSGGPERSP